VRRCEGLRRADVVRGLVAGFPYGLRVFFGVAGDRDWLPLGGFDEVQVPQPIQGGGPLAFAESHQWLAQPGQWLGAQGGQTIGRGRAVEQTQQSQDRDFHVPALALQPLLVRGEHAEGMASAGFHGAGFAVGFFEFETVTAGDVRWVERQRQKAAHQRQRQCVTFHLGTGLAQFLVRPGDAVSLQHCGSGGVRQMVQRPVRCGE
jgi:hypothetical protein